MGFRIGTRRMLYPFNARADPHLPRIRSTWSSWVELTNASLPPHNQVGFPHGDTLGSRRSGNFFFLSGFWLQIEGDSLGRLSPTATRILTQLPGELGVAVSPQQLGPLAAQLTPQHGVSRSHRLLARMA
jgi:hypothetical protein